MDSSRSNIRFQWLVACTAIILFLAKVAAFYLTGSVAILTDALESIINIASALLGVYSLYLSARPKDINHPYGHGKVEFLSSAVEGTLIIIAGILICVEAVKNLQTINELERIDEGILMVAATAVVNYVTGYFSVVRGKKHNSPALVAGGKHLQTDTYSTIGIIAGLVLIRLTGLIWIDSVVALIFAAMIIYTGWKILRKSVAGIMDEADEKLLDDVVEYLNSVRKENWIDLHNLRIIKYGSVLHIDCHLTVPWFLNVNQAHAEVDELSTLIREKFGNSVELFVHTDGCLDFSCKICIKEKCNVRQHALVNRINWNPQNVRMNKKHSSEDVS